MKAARQRRWYLKLRTEVIAGYGGKCACCGETYLPFLAIDHVAGDGAAERKAGGGQGNGQLPLYTRLRSEGCQDGRYQVLCHNCNVAKGTDETCPCPYRVGVTGAARIATCGGGEERAYARRETDSAEAGLERA